jgi:hypothetical protein
LPAFANYEKMLAKSAYFDLSSFNFNLQGQLLFPLSDYNLFSLRIAKYTK